jgi:dolichol-phosphate mannosyltransferase
MAAPIAPARAEPRVWIALPTYNERDNLEPMLEALLGHLPAAHVLVVDDSSPDGTGELADAFALRDPRVRVLHRPGKQGLGAAYRAAFRHLLEGSDADVIVQMDCDFSHDPADVLRLTDQIAAGADLAIGSRYVRGGDTPGWGLGRRLISRGGSTFARTVLRLPVRDLTGGFKAWRADLLRSLDLDAVETQGYGFQIEMTWSAHLQGAVIREIPIIFSERRAGASKMSRRIVIEALLMVLRLRAGGSRGRTVVSAGLGGRDALGSLVGGTGSVALDDLRAVPVPAGDGPSGGGLAAHRTGEAEPGT